MPESKLIRTSSAPIKVRVLGALAEIHGIDPGRVLPECLRFKHPQARYSRAFRSGDWDGMVDLFTGRQFPAGLAQRVIAYLNGRGESVRLVERKEKAAIDVSRLTPTYINDPAKKGFALRQHQMDAVLAVLKNLRGVVKSPTGSGKTEMMCAAARYLWEEFEYRTLVVEPKLGIARQTAQRFETYYQGDIKVGLFTGDSREVGPITVATAQTMVGFQPRMRRGKKGRPGHALPPDPLLREVIQNYEVLMFDECHHSSSDSWYEIAMHSGAIRRYGFSATPVADEDLRDARLIGATGPILFDARSVDLIEQGYAARPKIVMVMSRNASGPELPLEIRTVQNPHTRQILRKNLPMPYSKAYQAGIVDNEHHNRAVIRAVSWLVDNKRQTIVLCRLKRHFTLLAEMLEDAGIAFVAVWGATDSSDRDHAKAAFASRGINVVLATTIWDEGEDVQSVEAIVLAEGVKVSTNSRQRVGRGMRPDSDEVWIVDFVPTCHPKLTEHGYRRALAYEQEGYEVRVLDEWPSSDEFDFGSELLPFKDW